MKTGRGDRGWLSAPARQREREILRDLPSAPARVEHRIDLLIDRSRAIHEEECINLNPATNVMNPRAEAALARGLGSRPSLGHPGEKYETGLEAIEEIEVIAAELARRTFGAAFAEIRIASGAMANLYTFMATCRPGDPIIVPPPEIGGHITHHADGAAGLYGLQIHPAPVDADGYTVDVSALAGLARDVRPALITLGGSLNLLPHPVAAVRQIADEVGAAVLFDAAHLSGMIAGGAWPNPLDEGADVMTMSTYKSLGGPPAGLLVTNRADLAERIDAIAYPGMTANFDAGNTAALAIGLLDWEVFGKGYAAEMAQCAGVLAGALADRDLPVWRAGTAHTMSHQLAVDATAWGDGQQAAARLRDANLLACGIGLPGRGPFAGLRLGTNEIVRWGMTHQEMPELADLIADALQGDPAAVRPRTAALRERHRTLHHMRL